MQDADNVCTNIINNACDFELPSYEAIAQVVEYRCAPCHSPGTEIDYIPLHTPQALRGQHDALVMMVRDCVLPPTSKGQLVLHERRALMAWLLCSPPS